MKQTTAKTVEDVLNWIETTPHHYAAAWASASASAASGCGSGRPTMGRQAEIAGLRRTIAAQEAWGKFSVRNHNRLAQLEAEERTERWGFDWQKLAFWLLALAYCGLFWWQAFSQIWGLAQTALRAIIG